MKMTQDEMNESLHFSIANLGEQCKLLQEQIDGIHECITILQDGTRNGDMLLADAIEKNFEYIKAVKELVEHYGLEKSREIGLKGLAAEAMGKNDDKDI